MDYSLIIGSGGLFGAIGIILGFLLKIWSDKCSQKNHLDCFYAEHFVKVKAERIVKALDRLKFLVASSHESSTKFEDALLSFRESFLELYKIIDDKTYDSLSEYYKKLLEAAQNPKSRNQKELDDELKVCYDRLGQYIPKDYLFNKNL